MDWFSILIRPIHRQYYHAIVGLGVGDGVILGDAGRECRLTLVKLPGPQMRIGSESRGGRCEPEHRSNKQEIDLFSWRDSEQVLC